MLVRGGAARREDVGDGQAWGGKLDGLGCSSWWWRVSGDRDYEQELEKDRRKYQNR